LTHAAGQPFLVMEYVDGRSLADLRRMVRRLDPEQVTNYARQLCDGLAAVHERGLLHRDLKPANVLIADDGTPLLLDFNLSGDARVRGGVPAVLGGTLPYMAPEHLEAFQGGTRPVDARSDVYALGLMLFELSTGRHPFPVPAGKVRDQVPVLLAERMKGPPDPGRGVSPATAAILRHCLDPDPARRYPTARALAEDLQRQLDDRPLKHAREPFGRERLAKFVRRHPRATATAAVVSAAVLLAAGGVLYVRQARESAAVAAASQLRDFRDDFREARAVLGMPDSTSAPAGEEVCRRAIGRFNGPAWEDSPAYRALALADQAEVRDATGELLLLLARSLRLRAAADPDQRAALLDEARAANGRAAAVVGADRRRAVVLQRAMLEKLAGRPAEAEGLLAEGRAMTPPSERDAWLRAGELFAERRFREADMLLDAATRADPGDAIAWATRGACAGALGDHGRAAAHYTTAISLRPDFRRSYLWRARAHLDAGEFPAAIADLDAALARDANDPGALVLRGLARFRAGDLPAADADLTRALDYPRGPTRAWFLRARVRAARGDAAAAAVDTAAGLKAEPTDAIDFAARGDARLDAHDVPGALADYDAALRLHPGLRDAAQSKAHALSEHQNKPAEAVAVLDGLVETDPDYTEARVGRGVLLARLGKREAAHADAAESVRRDGRPLVAYQAGCVYALTGDADRAFPLLEKALRGGFGAEHIETDPDLGRLKADPRYKALADLARALRQ
ncbi:MAG TPA: protein kinase, partial [Gemmataceae bacterium]|nr:protein kinase [Gemmataceae bacterium]